ncbi:hypothetical protein OTK49_21325 [Vibrio coralliirubri]|uniref:hypothetical protein n=1 Tax=Vibrio coralliirubri TaxID=1516159 RepID=UPI0022837D4F|nr:hypothetical protein [Vibrio coralliirubri]MCY9865063.1 hypothetical protein [Vibrio coralliirubri]
MKSINSELIGKPEGKTRTVWVVGTFTTETSTLDWFYVKATAKAYFEGEKVIKHPSSELSQVHLFSLDVAEEMLDDDITDVIDNFYDTYVSKEEFYSSEHVQSFPYTAEGWKYIVTNLLG